MHLGEMQQKLCLVVFVRRAWSFAELHARGDAEALQHTVQIGRIRAVLKLDKREADASRTAECIERRVRIAQIDKVLKKIDRTGHIDELRHDAVFRKNGEKPHRAGADVAAVNLDRHR